MVKLTPKQKLKLISENEFLTTEQIMLLVGTATNKKAQAVREKANALAESKGNLVLYHKKAYTLDVLEVLGISIEHLRFLANCNTNVEVSQK